MATRDDPFPEQGRVWRVGPMPGPHKKSSLPCENPVRAPYCFTNLPTVDPVGLGQPPRRPIAVAFGNLVGSLACSDTDGLADQRAKVNDVDDFRTSAF